MTIKLLIADIDGTLVTKKKVLTPLTCDAVGRLRARGVEFTLTSGRPPRGMAKVVEPLKLTAPVAAFNGGVYIKPDLKTVLLERTLGKDIAREAIDHLLHRGLDVWVYQGPHWYIRNPAAPRVTRERSNVGFDPIVVEDLFAVVNAPVKIVGISEDHALVARCEEELVARLGSEAWAARSQPYYLDVTHPEANKGMVVREAARMLQLPLDEVAAIGDMSNDIPMLRTAGLSIAMGNAGSDVRRAARHVTRSNEEEGFAYAVDAFILGEPQLAQNHVGLPTRVRACVFGIEGVLTQTAGVESRAWKQLFDPYLRDRAHSAGQPFVPFDPAHDFAVHFDGRDAIHGVRSFLASRGVELLDATLAALRSRQSSLVTALLRHERLETYEGSIRFLLAVRVSGLRTAVVSPSPHRQAVLAAAGLADLVDATFESHRAAAQGLGVDREDIAVFEEERGAIRAARSGRLGHVVAVDRRGDAAELRRLGADQVVTDLAALLASGGIGGAGPAA